MESLAEFKQGKSGLNAAMPEVMKHLDGLFQVSQADGALSAKVKVLIGLGIGLATHCEACILVHMEKALAAGASRAEILEACGVAIAMGGGPTMADVPLVLKYLNERGMRGGGSRAARSWRVEGRASSGQREGVQDKSFGAGLGRREARENY